MKQNYNFKDYTNLRFGRLTVLKRVENSKDGKSCWECLCDCGNKTIVKSINLRLGKTKSCGCYQAEYHITHHLTGSRLYRIWNKMKNRCLNKKDKKFYLYGGKGVKICERWKNSFERFYEDMSFEYFCHCDKHGEMKTTIDRINSEGDYCKENCRWATYFVQNGHLKTKKCFYAVSPDGIIFESENQCEFARNHNLNSKIINHVLRGKLQEHKGWKFKYK